MKKIRKPRLAGKRLLQFTLFGNRWDVRLVPENSPHLKNDQGESCYGQAYLEENLVYMRETMTREQQQTTLVHEIEHIIEDHFTIEFKGGCATDQEADAWTDRIGLGWLYVIRGCPEVVAFVTAR